ncbi:ShlB/FhaC/HecB family hemolysin secretion/activation protein [Eikenella corrodens]|uniref:ShlB/FhaC/HecB family hemolysin secretion/activation protein n=1 Tax=Eikenella corrodens TaxID=539 RepID=UPI0013E04F1E|nr:ShlB/FhaC/HecB family hemolysin secretion/activation protein [Eikenella corrodens]
MSAFLLAYVSYSRDLGHKNDLTDRNGQKTDSGTRSYGAHYSVPFGNWLLAWNAGDFGNGLAAMRQFQAACNEAGKA